MAENFFRQTIFVGWVETSQLDSAIKILLSIQKDNMRAVTIFLCQWQTWQIEPLIPTF